MPCIMKALRFIPLGTPMTIKRDWNDNLTRQFHAAYNVIVLCFSSIGFLNRILFFVCSDVSK
jgi:hypothetical protein